MDEKYTAFFAKIAPRQPLLIRHFSLFFSFAREERFLLWKYCMRQKSVIPVHAVGGIIEM